MQFRSIFIALLVFTGFSSRAADTNSAAPKTATNGASGAAPATFEVRGYLVEGNTVLPPEKFKLLSKYTGPEVSLERVREGLKELQLLYRYLGFATVTVTLPRQRLTNGRVEVKVVEGKLAAIRVQGNRYFSSNNVMRALPSLDTNLLLNTKWFQPELDLANANSDRQIYPTISPGLEPGTSDLTLKVKDRLPLHGHIELNNKSTPDTPFLRLDTSVQYNNLWQLEHQVGIEYNFSPEAMKGDTYSPNVFDQPMVASYSGFYRIPFGASGSLRDAYDNLPVDFGYDQVTHQFRLPPSTGNPELIVFASRSASDTPPIYGPLTTITTNNPLADISSQFAERTLTFNNDLGIKFTLPIREFKEVKSAFSLGVDFKTYDVQTFNTNLTYFSLFSLDSFGNRVLVTNQTIALPGDTENKLHYLPLSFGWSASRPDKTGSFSFGLNDNLYLSALASPRTDFQAVANNAGAGGNYTTINANLSREQKLPGDWSLLLRGGGQWASAPLIGNEQMPLGGTGGVRGYREGEAYGDTGWRGMFDVRAPPLSVGSFPTSQGTIPAYLRCSWFMDYGQAFRLEDNASATVKEWGTGLGFYLNAGQHIDARLTVAWALLDTPITRAGTAQAYLSLGIQF